MSSSLSTIDGSGGTHNARSVTEAAQHTSEASMAMLQYGLSTLPALFVGTKPALRTKPMATESLRGANGEALVYPLPLVVRNTFIDCPQDRPASFDEFFFERKVASCPVSMISEPGSDIGAQYGDEAVAPPQSSLLRSKTATTVATAVTALATATAMAAAPWRRGPPAEKKSALEEEQLVRPATASTAGPPAAPSVVPSDRALFSLFAGGCRLAVDRIFCRVCCRACRPSQFARLRAWLFAKSLRFRSGRGSRSSVGWCCSV
ncbi:unnamed protein product [Polarella glacialis]|uniref:Uncharacterized protein n=1 Tax=Polarella glacialis TaxID=89957 RepID=A0A813JBP0_POLGL|nr:unnamed protein product [Polarella glacialis]